MKTLKQLVLYIAIPLSVLCALMVGCNIGQYEEPEHIVLATAPGHIELRIYSPAIAAQATVTGERKEAITLGFRMVADYIFGGNAAHGKIAMTTPVLQQSADRQTTETPVLQKAGDGGKWAIQFIMPAAYTRDVLPAPTNPEVKLVDIPGRKMVAIRFTGSTRNDQQIAKRIAELETYILTSGLRSVGAPVLAFYDPPWTVPFLRRNEVLLEVVSAPKARPKKR